METALRMRAPRILEPAPRGRFACAIGVLAAAALTGCALHQGAREQTIEVRIEADSPAWAGPLACRASNASGDWSFTAPGQVTVLASTTPLRIACEIPAGATSQPSVTPPGGASTGERSREGAVTGARVGAGAGAVLGLVAAPVMGGPFALILAVGAAIKGGEIGGMVGALRGDARNRYPSPVVLHIRNPDPGGLSPPSRLTP
jgi:hypothetical protein